MGEKPTAVQQTLRTFGEPPPCDDDLHEWDKAARGWRTCKACGVQGWFPPEQQRKVRA